MRLIVSINESSMTDHRNYNRIYRLLQCPYSSFIQVGLQAGAETSSGDKSEIIESSKTLIYHVHLSIRENIDQSWKMSITFKLHSENGVSNTSKDDQVQFIAYWSFYFFHPFMVDCLPWERWFSPLWSSKGKYKLIVSEINKILTINLFRF